MRFNTPYKKLNLLKDIVEDKLWTGYLWKSNQEAPIIYSKELIDKSIYKSEDFPYIREGYLSDGMNVSISIIHVDNGYQVNMFDLSKAPDQSETVEYFAHARMRKKYNIEKLQFVQYYEGKQNPNAPDGFVEKVPLVKVFNNFIFKNDQV